MGIVLEAKSYFVPDAVEYREVYGMTFSQKRNDVVITKEHMTKKVVTKGGVDALSDAAIRDMVVASICVKYTQSNSVGFAKDGMMVGGGAVCCCACAANGGGERGVSAGGNWCDHQL